MKVTEGKKNQQSAAERLYHQACRKYLPLVDPIGNVARGQSQEEHWNEFRQSDKTERQGRARDRVHLPTNSHGLDHHGGHGQKPAGDENKKVAVAIDRGWCFAHCAKARTCHSAREMLQMWTG